MLWQCSIHWPGPVAWNDNSIELLDRMLTVSLRAPPAGPSFGVWPCRSMGARHRRQDVLLGQPRHPVHRVVDRETVPVDRRRLFQTVLGGHLDHVAGSRPKCRPRHCPVVGHRGNGLRDGLNVSAAPHHE